MPLRTSAIWKSLRLGVRTNLLLARSIASAAARAQVHRLAFDFGLFEGGPTLPRRRLEELVPGDLEARVARPWAAPGQTSPYELSALALLAGVEDRERIVEFGTFDGRSTRVLAINAPRASITTLDLPPDERRWKPEADVGRFVVDLVATGRVRLHRGDSREFDESSLRGLVDFVFVEGGHGAEIVRSDSSKALAMVGDRPGRVVVWHDYGFIADVSRVVDEIARIHSANREWCWLDGTTLAVMRNIGGSGAS